MIELGCGTVVTRCVACWRVRGCRYKRGGKFCNDAIKILGHAGSKELTEMMQLNSTLHTNSAVVHMAMGNLQTAVSECKVAIKIFSGNMKAS